MVVRQVRKGKGVKKGSRPERILILSLSHVDSQRFYSSDYNLCALFTHPCVYGHKQIRIIDY